MTSRRRSLVLTTEAARHPFRASLPVAVDVTRPAPSRLRFTRQDAQDFATAFIATLVVVSVFIG